MFFQVFSKSGRFGCARSDTRNESGERGCDWAVVNAVVPSWAAARVSTDKDGCECENVVHRLGVTRWFDTCFISLEF